MFSWIFAYLGIYIPYIKLVNGQWYSNPHWGVLLHWDFFKSCWDHLSYCQKGLFLLENHPPPLCLVVMLRKGYTMRINEVIQMKTHVKECKACQKQNKQYRGDLVRMLWILKYIKCIELTCEEKRIRHRFSPVQVKTNFMLHNF